MKSIQTLFAEICYSAYINGLYKVSGFNTRVDRDCPSMRPGYFYNSLPEDVKERIKNELTSESIKKSISLCVLFSPPIEPWWDCASKNKSYIKEEKLKFELELMKRGWKPSFEL